MAASVQAGILPLNVRRRFAGAGPDPRAARLRIRAIELAASSPTSAKNLEIGRCAASSYR